MRHSRLCFILSFLLVSLAQSQPEPSNTYDLETTEIDGIQYLYVKDEILVKPQIGIEISDFASQISASIIDSIPEINWYRLKLNHDQDAFPVWEDLLNEDQIRACELHLMHKTYSDDFEGQSSGSRDEPPEEIQPHTILTRAEQVWSQIPQSDILIAILDSGIDQAHVMAVEFQGSDLIEVGRDWYNYTGGGVYDPAWDMSNNGHGTHRVGEIAAPLGNGGVAGIIAGGYGQNKQKCRVLVEKVASNGLWSYWGVPAALMYVVGERGARVIS